MCFCSCSWFLYFDSSEMSHNDKEPLFVKFLKSSDNSECFFKALEVRLLENVLFDAVNSFSCF